MRITFKDKARADEKAQHANLIQDFGNFSKSWGISAGSPQ